MVNRRCSICLQRGGGIVMSKYLIHITSEITIKKLQKGLFIFIFRATKIPPHIGIIANGMLYDITSVGPNIDLPVSDFYNTILKRKTEVVFVELAPSNGVDLNQLITDKVKKYWKVTSNTSCLNPVKDFLSGIYDIDVSKAKFIFELLPVLYEKKLINSVSEVNLTNKITNNIFELTKYTEKDVEKCIEALHRKEKDVC